jgi:hypothetical protein
MIFSLGIIVANKESESGIHGNYNRQNVASAGLVLLVFI